MAAAPIYAATPRHDNAAVVTANTNRDGTGTIADFFTAGASGSILERIRVKPTGDPADSVLTIFLHNGTTYELFDEIDLGNPAAGSTTVTTPSWEITYNIVLEAGQKMGAAITVALTAGEVNVFGIGGDF